MLKKRSTLRAIVRRHTDRWENADHENQSTEWFYIGYTKIMAREFIDCHCHLSANEFTQVRKLMESSNSIAKYLS